MNKADNGWVLAGKYDDAALPPPFHRSDSNNLGAQVWTHLTTGAMLAAIPTAPWNKPGSVEFHYAAPNSATTTVHLAAWQNKDLEWTGSVPTAAHNATAGAARFVDRILSGWSVDMLSRAADLVDAPEGAED